MRYESSKSIPAYCHVLEVRAIADRRGSIQAWRKPCPMAISGIEQRLPAPTVTVDAGQAKTAAGIAQVMPGSTRLLDDGFASRDFGELNHRLCDRRNHWNKGEQRCVLNGIMVNGGSMPN